MREKKTLNLHNMVLIAMMAAVAAVLMLIEVPLPFLAPEFYKMDVSEVPVLIGTFAMGPAAGLMIEAIKILLHLVMKGTSTAYVGELANFVVGSAFLIPAGLVYRWKKTKKTALFGLILGTVSMVVMGCLANGYVLLPWYANNFFGGMEPILAIGQAVNGRITSVASFVILAVAPFNLVKGIIVSLITMLLYKRISVLIKEHHG
ncbi:MAG: ECF transporter S component [Clostridiales bacterium]|nr:ECF transporter S component [Clostridiales bacterium]